MPATRKHILVVGFSVTADTPGYVEAAARLPQVSDCSRLEKIGIGGIHLPQLKFLMPGLLEEHRPDLVILEIATSAIRMSRQWMAVYGDLLDDLLDCCRARGVGIAILDLPRHDVDYATDALVAHHAAICARLGISYARVELRPDLLRDGVHPSPAGHAHYAAALLDLVEKCDAASIPDWAPHDPPFRALEITSLVRPDRARYPYRRAGYQVDMVRSDPDEPIRVTIPDGWQIVGLSYLIGPRSGRIRISDAVAERRMAVYDQHSYYERFGATVFAGLPGPDIVVEQLPEMPGVALLKGEPDTSARVGYLAHVFVAKAFGHG